MEAAESTLEHQDQPDSLEAPEQEPEEVAVEPSPEADATDPDEIAAADEAGSVEQPDDEGAATDGQPRDERGRFASAEAAPSTPGPSQAEHSPAGEPFHFRVDGYRVDVEGATEHDGKITIPRSAWESVVQNRLADRGRIQQTQERMQSRIRTLESEAEAREGRFKTVLGKVDELFADPARIRAFVERYELEAPRFRLEIENELLKSQTKRHETELQSGQQEAEEREFRELAPQGLANAVDVVLDHMEAKVLDKKAIVDELQGLWEMNVPVFFRVQEGDGSGIDPREHKWGVNLALVERIAKPHVQLHQKSEAATKAAAVEAANKAALGKGTKSKAPPVAPAAGSPTPGGESKIPTTREEYEEYKRRRSAELNLPM